MWYALEIQSCATVVQIQIVSKKSWFWLCIAPDKKLRYMAPEIIRGEGYSGPGRVMQHKCSHKSTDRGGIL